MKDILETFVLFVMGFLISNSLTTCSSHLLSAEDDSSSSEYSLVILVLLRDSQSWHSEGKTPNHRVY